jgi:hypothetical protein
LNSKFPLGPFGAAALCALTLGACGGQAATAPVVPNQVQAVVADPPSQDIPCGTVTATGGAQAKVIVRQGGVDCADATTLLTRYFAKLTPADLASPDGAGPVALDPWTCGSDPGATLTATCSTEDGREIDTQPSP